MLLGPRKEKKKKERDPINTHTVLFSKDVPADVPAVHTETCRKTHIYSALLSLWWSEKRLGVFMLPTVVLKYGWMEVKLREWGGGLRSTETDVLI